ncbi:MAG: response regulator [Armatimonadota bacterium]|nr:response regulator [Armatimonadota bacterium]MCX7777433.1 response regulator [Armatimonadota bacterium]MDW8025102.1 response regulator [Armatimonadota bacterium]
MSFREVVFVLIWDMDIAEERAIGFRVHEEGRIKPFDREAIKERLKRQGMPDELLAYIQHIIVFRPLERQDLIQIARRKLEELREKLYRQEGKVLDIDFRLVENWLVTDRALPSPLELEQLVEQHILLPLQDLKSKRPEDWASWKVITVQMLEGEMQPARIKPRLLVVDDVTDFWEALKDAYPEWVWYYAATVEEAEQVIKRERPHLVLVDTCQSATDPTDVRGLEVLRKLKEHFPNQTIVMVTAQPMSFEATREAFKSGAYDYLWKPPEESVLRQIIALLVEREEQEQRLAYQQNLLKRYLSVGYEVRPEEDKVRVIYSIPSEGVTNSQR